MYVAMVQLQIHSLDLWPKVYHTVAAKYLRSLRRILFKKHFTTGEFMFALSVALEELLGLLPLSLSALREARVAYWLRRIITTGEENCAGLSHSMWRSTGLCVTHDVRRHSGKLLFNLHSHSNARTKNGMEGNKPGTPGKLYDEKHRWRLDLFQVWIWSPLENPQEHALQRWYSRSSRSLCYTHMSTLKAWGAVWRETPTALGRVQVWIWSLKNMDCEEPWFI